MHEKEITLTSGQRMPLMGFGTWQLTGETAQNAVESALSIGYRHIDTADHYGNHRDIAQAIQNSSLERGDIFLTSKVWRDALGYDDVINATERFLNELETTYLDLLLIHWPNNEFDISDTLRAFADLQNERKILSIGVSNFTTAHLKEALDSGVAIDNNQVEFHPTLNQHELKSFCDEHDIALTAYSPTAQGDDMDVSVIQDIAQEYKKAPAQVILNWLMQKGIVVIPRSQNPEHIKENFEAQTFSLSNEDMERIEAIEPKTNRILEPSFAEFDT